MFTGIVEAGVPVRAFTRVAEGARLVLSPPNLPGWVVGRGDSVAVSGCCLTVAALSEPAPGTGTAEMTFDLSAETLARTWFGELEEGRAVNLERPLALGGRLDGHLVSGHVDGGGRIARIRDSDDGGRLFTFEVDEGLERYLIDKGSVTLDGTSLTVVAPRGCRFDVAVIPATLELTSLGEAQEGQRVNVEADMIGKWIERLLPGR